MSFKTKIYIADCDSLKDEALFEKLFSCVKRERQQKIEKMRFDKDKRLSLGAELLLINALNDFNIDYENAEFCYGENGKPYLKNNEIFFNLSHSGKYAACAVSENEVGIDIEDIFSADMKIAKRIFTEKELVIINSAADENAKKQSFIRFWTLKESYMKYCGKGLSIHPRDIEIELVDNKAHYEKLLFFESKIGDYMLSCCAENNEFEDEITIVDFNGNNF